MRKRPVKGFDRIHHSKPQAHHMAITFPNLRKALHQAGFKRVILRRTNLNAPDRPTQAAYSKKQIRPHLRRSDQMTPSERNRPVTAPDSSARSPAIAIVVPSRDAERTLDLCLQSLDKQDFPRERVEVIVVCSGGQEAKNICAKYRVICIQKAGSSSPGEARNVGLEAAKGDVIAFMDADCVAPNDWLKRIERDFEDFPTVVGVLGFYQGGKSI